MMMTRFGWTLKCQRGRWQVSSHDAPRRGISLLEIMISIGVVGIGLIGVAALIPLAHHKASEGVREERKALFGKRAYREFFVHEFDRPGWWLNNGQGSPYWVSLHPQGPYAFYHSSTTGQVMPQTYCFDPHWIAARLSLAPPMRSITFPDEGPSEVLIPRITVLAHRPEILRESLMLQGATPALASIQTASFVNSPIPLIVSLPRADEIFRLRDDLIIEAPDNPNDIARQTYLTEMSPAYAASRPVKRVAHGGFSWLATLVPELNSTVDPSNPSIFIPYATNRNKLSIVIFNQRNLLGNYREEVVAQVAPPPGSLMTGAIKEIMINEVGPSPPVPENVGVRHIRPGDWIALVQRTMALTHLTWYQVVSTDQQESDTTMVRQLSLSGPDWNPNWLQPIYAIYLRNVETVFEKTVELQP